MSVVGTEAYLPRGVVDGPVVVAAEEGEVVDRRLATVRPVAEVVGVAQGGWTVAGREGAVAVAGDQGGPDGGGD
jgi:hypothetical protein